MSDLADFVARYARSYDPETDTYRRPPFASPVKAGKATAIYNAHSYHTKVPPQGIEPYIAHYTDPGDLVLDPFCGSGMTGVAALKLGRRVILNDLSPAAAHIAYNYCTPVDVDELKREFERIKATVKDEMDWLYGMTCDQCGGSAIIQYTVWSDVFLCGRCGDEIVLWDVAIDHDTGKVKERFTCSKCNKEQTKLGLQRRPSVPVLTTYECPTCTPHRKEHITTASERERISEIESRTMPYWVPSTEFDREGPQYRRNALSSRGIRRVTDLYTKRNLWALARLWHEAGRTNDPRMTSALRFALTAINNYINRKQSYGGGGGGLSGSIYIPSFAMEKNVWLVFERKVESLIGNPNRTIDSECIVTVGSATSYPEIKESSIDYIFTDPPFGSNLYYSEVNLLWEAWLQQFTEAKLEAVVHRKQDGGTKRLGDYAALMTTAFREMHRVLKPARWASVVFHNSDDKIWQAILDSAEVAGLELVEVNSFDKEQLTFKGSRGAKGLERATNKDIVLNLRKPAPKSVRSMNGTSARNGDAEARVVQRVAEHLAANPGSSERTLQHFWNVVLHEMLANGVVEVSMEQVGDMLPHYFKQVDGRWYLRGEAVLGGNVFDLKSDAGALAWLTSVLNEPQTTGDLIPKWQAITAQSSEVDPGRLERLLEQNFWIDKKTGRWRVPTEAERQKMSAAQDLSAEAHLRVIRKFLDGQLDRRPGNRELAEWVRFAYHREAYAEAVALYAQVDEGQLEPEYVRDLRKIVAVCRMKAGQQASAQDG